MDRLPPLNSLSVKQKDDLILALWEENALLKEQVAALKVQVDHLTDKVADLEAKLKTNSRNSNKPPSSDSFKKWPSLKPKSDKSSGGQKGHTGRTLKLTDTPDRVIKHSIQRCPHCCFSLAHVNNLRWKKAQVFDIPELKVEVEEHLIEEKILPTLQ
jgi:hypothetical protein